MAINAGDAVLKFVGDTQSLDATMAALPGKASCAVFVESCLLIQKLNKYFGQMPLFQELAQVSSSRLWEWRRFGSRN